ncbi:MAG: PAS domain-containing protein [Candidatus Lokiarchaeota archaeon]
MDKDINYPLDKRKLLEYIFDAVIITDINLNVKTWNKAAERIYGWKEKEIINKSLHKVLKTQLFNQSIKEAYENFLGEGYWLGDAIQYTKEGKKLYISCSSRLIFNDNGKPIGVVAINRDITQRVVF